MLGKVDSFCEKILVLYHLILVKRLRLLMAFNGFNGTVEKLMKKRKLEVMVKIFGEKTPLILVYAS
jgi:transcriptional antiterminator NusG